ncbi:MAG: CoA transferase [Bacteroidetes bacterium]|nr:CoA transferase [Bacteroidota bacterium]
MEKPFAGLKVIELASVLAGPAVGMFFAELGAKVLKIENPLTGGDITRQWKGSEENKESSLSAYYQSVNWGKEILFIDISTQSGYDQLLKLLENADILLTNFKAGDAQKFKLAFNNLSEKFPKLICANLSGYNENDPRHAFDLVMQAETGFMSMNGTPDSGPLKMPVAFIDLMAAHQLKEGILTALYLREKNGIGNSIHVSLFDSAIASLANQASNFLITGNSPQLMGSLHPNIAPYGETFLCADARFIVLAIGTEKQFSQFCTAIEKPELIDNPKFCDNASRVLNRNELQEHISGFFQNRIATQASSILARAGVPAAIVRSVSDVLQSEEVNCLLLDNKLVRTAIFKLN